MLFDHDEGWFRISAYAVVVDERDRILLCRIANTGGADGRWTLPGGGLEFGEHPETGALRELREETGFEGRIDALLGIESALVKWPRSDGPPRPFHYVQVLYRVHITGGALRREVDGGTTDAAAWIGAAEALHLPLVRLARVGLRYAGLTPS